MNIERNEPTHVGHAINKPVVAPIVLNPPLFLPIEIAEMAIDVFSATKYETMV